MVRQRSAKPLFIGSIPIAASPTSRILPNTPPSCAIVQEAGVRQRAARAVSRRLCIPPEPGDASGGVESGYGTKARRVFPFAVRGLVCAKVERLMRRYDMARNVLSVAVAALFCMATLSIPAVAGAKDSAAEDRQ